MFVDSFVEGHYSVRSLSGKQTFVFEDSDQFGPSVFDARSDEVSPVPDKHWFWKFYQAWRDAGRPTDGEQTYRYGTIKRAVWPAALAQQGGRDEQAARKNT